MIDWASIIKLDSIKKTDQVQAVTTRLFVSMLWQNTCNLDEFEFLIHFTLLFMRLNKVIYLCLIVTNLEPVLICSLLALSPYSLLA